MMFDILKMFTYKCQPGPLHICKSCAARSSNRTLMTAAGAVSNYIACLRIAFPLLGCSV